MPATGTPIGLRGTKPLTNRLSPAGSGFVAIHPAPIAEHHQVRSVLMLPDDRVDQAPRIVRASRFPDGLTACLGSRARSLDRLSLPSGRFSHHRRASRMSCCSSGSATSDTPYMLWGVGIGLRQIPAIAVVAQQSKDPTIDIRPAVSSGTGGGCRRRMCGGGHRIQPHLRGLPLSTESWPDLESRASVANRPPSTPVRRFCLPTELATICPGRSADFARPP